MSFTPPIRRPRALAALTGLVVGAGVLAGAPLTASAAPTGASSTYVVLYRAGASTSDAASTVKAAGGTLVAAYPQIGVVIARSDQTGFASSVRLAKGVQGAASTAGLATHASRDAATAADASGDTARGSASWGDSLSWRQWDMEQINVPNAHKVTTGSKSVLVGDLDTGLDYTHPDLAPNVDLANSADCSSGTAMPLLPGNDANGHGTHTAGTIAAAANGAGIVGVAPNVRIAGIKTANDDGFFFPEMVICGYMWVASHGIDITNNSYFADPWLFNCKNDADQRAIWEAERRAIRFAQSKGTLVIASEGNDETDLSHPTMDIVSPDDTTPVDREITNACSVVPVEVPGVVGVTATGNKRIKSFYSSYGISTADVAAPGGDSRLQVTPDATNGRVLSTWPAAAAGNCLRQVWEDGALYCYAQGTSMAGPHAVGVAALLQSASGKRGGALGAALQQATNAIGCPDAETLALYDPYPQNSGAPQTCQGGAAHNSWYGSGEVDALKAVQ